MADGITIYSETSDSTVGITSANWATARGSSSTTGDYHNNTQLAYAFGIYNIYSSGRSGTAFNIRRSFFVFDLATANPNTITDADVEIYLDFTGAGNSDLVLVDATSLAGSTDDYGNVFQPGGGGTTMGTPYSDPVSISTTAGYHTFTMTSDALTNINSVVGSSGSIIMGLMGNYYDNRDNAPPLNGDYMKVTVYYSDYPGTSRNPKINLTYEGAAVTDNATFFGANF